MSEATKRIKIEITPGVARLLEGRCVNMTDKERDEAIYEYLKEKYNIK